MTEVIITAKSKDVAQYNRDMSALNEALSPIAEKLGGSAGICPGDEPGKPGMSVSFNDAAAAASFTEAAQAAVAERKWKIGPHKLPGANFRQG